MGQAITDYIKFLTEARDAVYRLNCDQSAVDQMTAQEAKQERELEAARKEVSDTITRTIKQRTEEISSSYDVEIGKAQERLKKVRAKREKARNQGVKDRIAEETKELKEERRGLQVQLKTGFQKDRVPAFYRTGLYYALFYPRSFGELGLFLLVLLLCFLAVPCGIYFLIPQRKLWQLILIYFLDVLGFGGLYVKLGNHARLHYQEAIKEARGIKNQLRGNQKKIRIVTRTIQRDGNESIYNLEKYDDEIACVEQELSEITQKKKEALVTFENVTKNILSDEIEGSHREHIEELERSLKETETTLRSLENSIREQNIHITDTYGPYLGKEFLDTDRLAELTRFISDKSASNITEAIELYKREQENVNF